MEGITFNGDRRRVILEDTVAITLANVKTGTPLVVITLNGARGWRHSAQVHYIVGTYTMIWIVGVIAKRGRSRGGKKCGEDNHGKQGAASHILSAELQSAYKKQYRRVSNSSKHHHILKSV